MIDAGSTPAPDSPGLAWAASELAVLAALTGAVDLNRDSDRHLVLRAIGAGGERLETLLILSGPPCQRRPGMPWRL